MMIGKSLGHFEILDAIGAGGMGHVYRARDKKLDRNVAIKLLPDELRHNKEALARFQREAKALAALNHPNIVTIYSVEEDGDDFFLAMELVEGKPLDQFIQTGGMTVDEFMGIASPLVDAVAAAHAKGVVHRDLKPSNIMLDAEKRVKVLDFGLAKFAETAADTDDTLASDAETKAGEVFGTVAYMSPEQAEGQSIDARSDIFSLGIVLYEMATGKHPFQGKTTVSTLSGILKDTPAAVGELNSLFPAALDSIISRCLRKTPEERYATAGELCRPLKNIESSPGPTSAARAAFDEGDWKTAYETLHATQSTRKLSPEELEMLATCADWMSEVDECIDLHERVYAIYSKARQNVDAGRIATLLTVDYLHKGGASAVSRGWQKKAERLLESEPVSIDLGSLRRRQSMVALGKGDIELATKLNDECANIAKHFDNIDLQMIALHDRGQILVARGDVAEGIELIDEAMTSAVGGEVGPWTLGVLYCRTMSVCEALADFNRAREWSEAAWRWTEGYAESPFPGVCRIHSAETMRHLGLWAEAEQAARKACEDFTKHHNDAHLGEALNEIGELALRKGDYEEADAAFRQAHEHGFDPVPGLPMLRLAQGKGEAAAQTIERALSESKNDRLRRAKLLSAGITIALANGKFTAADAAADELLSIAKDYGCPAFQAHALMGKGSVDLERGDHDRATNPLREAWTILNEIGFPYDAARARILLARAYLQAGNKEDARMQLEAATKTFRDLGAKRDSEAASELIGRSG